LSNGKKIFDDVRSNKHIVKVKGAGKGGVARADYWK
jgi:hypothetical protein